MPSVINPFQVAFVKGRRLQDAVVLANEVVHSLYCLRLPSFILKLDISKAFDSVSWEFLSELLTHLAFGLSFRQWIMSLVTGAQLAVSFNGKCGDFFCLERGLRQDLQDRMGDLGIEVPKPLLGLSTLLEGKRRSKEKVLENEGRGAVKFA
ncbi:hypothetical protein EJ110_NYTH19488 [Nymphaea thermarum]|nr:hypothetical protein EJ110_NYTH19488 [Nymphaea thermarum]